MKLTELRDQQARLVTQARSILDEIKSDTPEARAKELEAQHDAAMAEFDALEARAKREEALEARAAALNAPDPRRPVGEDRAAKPVAAEEVRPEDVFKRFVQFGASELRGDERRALAALRAPAGELRAQGTGTTAGGYTIPQGFMAEIERSMLAYGPMLDGGITRVIRTATGNALPWPTVDDTSNSGEDHTENTAGSDQDVTFGQKQLDAYVHDSGTVKVSYELLQDSAFELASLLSDLFGERLGRRANSKLTTGTGSSQANGIVTASSLGKTAASATAIAADELIDFYHSIDPAYRASPKFRFMFNDSTLAAIRKLKDGQGNYLIDSLRDNGATINLAGISVPYSVNQAMASIATGNKVIVAGDFNKYVVRLVKDFSLIRMDELYAAALQVGFLAYIRLDGECVNTAAIKHYKMA